MIVLGDFNTYRTKGGSGVPPADDFLFFESLFSALSIMKIKNTDYFTYVTNRYQNVFDHIFVSSKVTVKGEQETLPICSKDFPLSKNHLDVKREINDYNENYSDHCPISANLSFQI